jgi:hypothetical protein
MKTKKNNRLGSGMQALEHRCMMAGDVAASLNLDGVLTITGDNASNQIRVAEVDGRVELTGQSTTINGSSSTFSRSANFVHTIIIDMNGGHDKVAVNNLNLDNLSYSDLRIWTDAGRDTVTIYNTFVRDDIYVYSGVDDDDVIASYTETGDNFYVSTDDGGDEIDLYRVTSGNDIDIFAGKGNDDVAIQRSVAADNLDVDLGSGKDVLWNYRGQYREVNALGGADDDRITFDRATVLDKFYADMGSGNDQLILTNNTSFGYRGFYGGSGSDTLSGSGNNFNPWSYDHSF